MPEYTPLAESAIVGCAVGAALLGMRADRGDPVRRFPGAGIQRPGEQRGEDPLAFGAGPCRWWFGSPTAARPETQSTCCWVEVRFTASVRRCGFVHTPGWKSPWPLPTLSMPRALMISAVRDENPVIFLESKGLYGFFRTDSASGAVPLGVEHRSAPGRRPRSRARASESDDRYLRCHGMDRSVGRRCAGRAGHRCGSRGICGPWCPLDEKTLFRIGGEDEIGSWCCTRTTRRGGDWRASWRRWSPMNASISWMRRFGRVHSPRYPCPLCTSIGARLSTPDGAGGRSRDFDWSRSSPSSRTGSYSFDPGVALWSPESSASRSAAPVAAEGVAGPRGPSSRNLDPMGSGARDPFPPEHAAHEGLLFDAVQGQPR